MQTAIDTLSVWRNARDNLGPDVATVTVPAAHLVDVAALAAVVPDDARKWIDVARLKLPGGNVTLPTAAWSQLIDAAGAVVPPAPAPIDPPVVE